MSYTKRNFSPRQMFMNLADNHTPQYEFKEGNDFQTWKDGALEKVLKTIGDSPKTVDLNPELIAEWEQDGLKKQRWHIDVSEYISAALLVNIPMNLKDGDKAPAILCCHGHGAFGKEAVMGNDSSPELANEIQKLNYNYGHQMAKNGYVTFAIDWIGFGERNDNNKPNNLNLYENRDICNIYYLHATMLGMTSLSINITHGKAAIDFAESLPFIHSDRIGVMGLSGGGTMTLWMALCDERLKAAEIICYSDLWKCFGIRDANYCGMQVAPSLYKYVDLPDLQGLLAPKPLLIDIGANDTCFKIDSSIACYNKLKSIYSAADALDNLELDLHKNAHAWGANKSVDFFNKHC